MSWLPAPKRHASTDPTAELPPIAPAGHVVASRVGTKLATLALTASLLLGPVGLAAAGWALWLHFSSPRTTAAATTSPDTSAPWRAAEYAQTVVVTWLTTSRDDTQRLHDVLGVNPGTALPATAFTATNPTIAAVEPVSEQAWSVTVSVWVTDLNGITARRHYQVPVRYDSQTGSVTALALPAPVAPPAVTAPGANVYRSQLTTGSEVGETVSRFLAAYAAGDGDVARYLTPEAALTPITPAPHTEIRLSDLRSTEEVDDAEQPTDGQQVKVLATATAVVTDQQAIPVTYPLTLQARDGRWEIASIDAATAVTGSAPTAQPPAQSATATSSRNP